MTYTVVFRRKNVEYYAELAVGSNVSFGTHKKDTVQVPDTEEHQVDLKIKNNAVRVRVKKPLKLIDSEIVFDTVTPLDDDNDALIYVSSRSGRSRYSLNLPYNGRIKVGRNRDNDIAVSVPVISGEHFQLLCEAGKVHVEDLGSTNGICLNGKQISKSLVKSGDVLSVLTFRFVYQNGVLYFENFGDSVHISDDLKKSLDENDVSLSSPVYSSTGIEFRLSPRVREQLPQDPIVLAAVPGHGNAPGTRRGNFAYLISSGAMMAASLATGTISPSALLMRATGMISPVANMAMYGKMSKEEKKHLEEYEKMRDERYRAYVDEQKARIDKVADVQRRIISVENPAPEKCLKSVMEVRRNLWERMSTDNDFLHTRIGIGKDKLCVEVKSHTNADGFQMQDDDELEELAKSIIEDTRYVDNIPVRIPFAEYSTIGLIGPKITIQYELRNILIELTAQHSHKDLRIVAMFDEDSSVNWGILRWLPHLWDESGQVRYIAFDEDRRHTVAELLSDLVKKRKEQTHPNNGKTARVLPHYLVILENQELLQNETVYDEFLRNNADLGITCLILGDDLYDLPQTCQYIIDMNRSPVAYERNKYDERTYFMQDELIHSNEMDEFARKMAAIELVDKKEQIKLPSSVTFLQGYGANKVEDLNIYERWKNSKPFATLAAPIGVMEGGKQFYLDIKDGDQAHGPHGLLAGTTGSGKSELLQTWILSMAVNYHPHDVNFVIIDYKGGGMSDLMQPLPHVVGKITNIDRNITRSLVSLKAELKRRQRLFSQCGVNNIGKYQEKYKDGTVKEPLPHLIIVTDEFAEMKKEEPEFMTELNSVATIGRTLGIHLLLATQKPAGVVSDQINANSRFRICMKVQDVADSREMLKRSDAARITQAGRAYVRVGEDEVFELFQSFYSAAEYSEHALDKAKLENPIRIIGHTGNRINPLPKKKKEKHGKDELSAVIEHLNQVCTEYGIEKMKGPWLPELPKMLSLQTLLNEEEPEKQTDRMRFAIPVGRYDIPELQMQGTQYLDFSEIGHFGIYGSVGMGKTVFLKTVLCSTAYHYSPEEVKVYVLDANSLTIHADFGLLPHVAEFITNQENDKVTEFAKNIYREMDMRRNAFVKYAVNSVNGYFEASGKKLNYILIMIDNITAMKEENSMLESVLQELASNGAKYGIHMIYTANSTMGISYKFTQLIKGAVALMLPDKGDYSQIVGPVGGISLPNYAGRALMRSNPPVAFHTAIYAEGSEAEKHQAMTEYSEMMNDDWQSYLQASKAVNVTNMDDLMPSGMAERNDSIPYLERHLLPVGRNTKDMEPVYADMLACNVLLVCGADNSLVHEYLYRFENLLSSHSDNQMIHMTVDNFNQVTEELTVHLNQRTESRKLHQRDSSINRNWLDDMMQICIVIDDIAELSEKLNDKQRRFLGNLIRRTSDIGVSLVAGALKPQLLNEDRPDAVTYAVKKKNALIVDGNPQEYLCFTQGDYNPEYNVDLNDGEAALITKTAIHYVKNL